MSVRGVGSSSAGSASEDGQPNLSHDAHDAAGKAGRSVGGVGAGPSATLALARALDMDSLRGSEQRGPGFSLQRYIARGKNRDDAFYTVNLKAGEAVYVINDDRLGSGYWLNARGPFTHAGGEYKPCDANGQVIETPLFGTVEVAVLKASPTGKPTTELALFVAPVSGLYAFQIEDFDGAGLFADLRFENHFYVKQGPPRGLGGNGEGGEDEATDANGMRYVPEKAEDFAIYVNANFATNPHEGFASIVLGILEKLGNAAALFSPDIKELFDDTWSFAERNIFDELGDIDQMRATNSYGLGGLLIDFCPGLGDVVGIMEAIQGVCDAWAGMIAQQSATTVLLFTLAGVGLIAAIIALVPLVGDLIGKALRKFLDAAMDRVRELAKAIDGIVPDMALQPELVTPNGTVIPAAYMRRSDDASSGLRRMEQTPDGSSGWGEFRGAGFNDQQIESLLDDLAGEGGANALTWMRGGTNYLRLKRVLTELSAPGVASRVVGRNKEVLNELIGRLSNPELREGAMAELENAARLLKKAPKSSDVHFSIRAPAGGNGVRFNATYDNVTFGDIPEVDAAYTDYRRVNRDGEFKQVVVAQEVKSTARGVERFFQQEAGAGGRYVSGSSQFERHVAWRGGGTSHATELVINDPTDWASGLLWRFSEPGTGMNKTAASILGDAKMSVLLGDIRVEPGALNAISGSFYRRSHAFEGGEAGLIAHLNQLGLTEALKYLDVRL